MFFHDDVPARRRYVWIPRLCTIGFGGCVAALLVLVVSMFGKCVSAQTLRARDALVIHVGNGLGHLGT